MKMRCKECTLMRPLNMSGRCEECQNYIDTGIVACEVPRLKMYKYWRCECGIERSTSGPQFLTVCFRCKKFMKGVS